MYDGDFISVNELLNNAFKESNQVLDLGALFEQKLKEYDLSKTKVFNLLNIDKDTFDDIINGSPKQPNLINVIKIAQFLEISIDDAVTALLKNQSSENVAAIQKATKASFIAKNFDIKKLHSIGFFDDSDDIDIVTDRILAFFGYDSIYDYETQLNTPFYSSSKRKYSDKMKDFWIKSAYQCFKSINNPHEYDREALKDLITKIKPYCQDVENGLFTVCRALYNIGITVIVQHQLVTTQVRGGTFVINGKPCIVLTDLFKRYTTLWFTLIHELHHVLYDLDAITDEQYHLTGDPDLLLIEDKADEFAREYFCGLEKYNFIKSQIHNPFVVDKKAKDWEVHRAFIYSSFQYFEKELNGKSYYGAFGDYFPDCNLAIDDLRPISWKEKSLPDIAVRLKQIFELKES